jgi:hypothetical protein
MGIFLVCFFTPKNRPKRIAKSNFFLLVFYPAKKALKTNAENPHQNFVAPTKNIPTLIFLNAKFFILKTT